MFSALLPLIVSTTWCTADLLKLSQQHCSKAPVHHLWPDDAMEMCHNVVDLIATSQQYIRWHWVAIAPRGPQEWRRVTVSAQQVDINSMDKVLRWHHWIMPLLRDLLSSQLQGVLAIADGHMRMLNKALNWRLSRQCLHEPQNLHSDNTLHQALVSFIVSVFQSIQIW